MINEEIRISNIDKHEAARYLGYKDTLPDVNITKMILEDEEKLLRVMKPRYCYKVFDIERKENVVRLKGAELVMEGTSISEHLKDCGKAAVMCATLSGDVDKLLRQYEVSEMIHALITDALANAAIEQVCDKVEEILMREFEGYNHTWRFGVGYGDFPLSAQKQLLETLDAGKRIGVCSTESCILTPRKSVTCVIGLSKKSVNSKKSCDNCNLKDTCNLRRNGTSCNH